MPNTGIEWFKELASIQSYVEFERETLKSNKKIMIKSTYLHKIIK
jgi:hypothetical protein